MGLPQWLQTARYSIFLIERPKIPPSPQGGGATAAATMEELSTTIRPHPIMRRDSISRSGFPLTPTNIYRNASLRDAQQFSIALVKMVSHRSRRYLETVIEYGPVASHGDAIQTRNYPPHLSAG